MRKLILRIILTILILDTVPLEQVLKAPILYQHFLEHQVRDRDIAVSAFLFMHYFGNDMDDNDDERDMQLPFKRVEFQAPPFVFIPVHKNFTFQNSCWTVPAAYGVEHPQVYINPALGSLFRPPRG